MKLRFGIDPAAREHIRARLDERCKAPPVGRRLNHVYLDTPDDALAAHGIALRFKRSAAIGLPSPKRPWRRQLVGGTGASLKSLGIPRLKQRLDATFTVRILRWTWTLGEGEAVVSLDETEISTGDDEERFSELSIVCAKRHVDMATRIAVELGATHRASTKTRERGFALLRNRAPSPV